MINDPRLPDRFWRKVSVVESGCWHWTGYVDPAGYGQFGLRAGKTWGAHRYAYHVLVGPVSPGRAHPIDHLCHNDDPTCNAGPACLHRRCVNPAHLRLTTVRANLMAGRTPARRNAEATHCKHGHELTPDNVYIRNRPGGGRQCRRCQIDNRTRRRREMRAATH